MLLTLKEKKYLMKLLAKQKRNFWSSKEEQQMAKELLKKFEQNTRNEKVNDMKESKL
ncbi:hypothetical protein [Anaerobacillus alkalilacustris]|uniref:hypothetical protein n=1 Tax=Anaerobacillus alkalilacustris TaxID=393763 RepID=UPI000AD44FE7|nr:hypothetical protein [Anaerobacillus alkalilacustris]